MNLREHGLTRVIPLELGDLTNLTSIDLEDNHRLSRFVS